MSDMSKNRLLDVKMKQIPPKYGSTLQQDNFSDEEVDDNNRIRQTDINNNINYHNLRPAISTDEFGSTSDFANKTSTLFANKVTRTGRQRKKLAARTKGGEFEQRRKKRRVNFCCICSEIDLEGLNDAIANLPGNRWEAKIYEDVLHLFQNPSDENTTNNPYTYNNTYNNRPVELHRSISLDAESHIHNTHTNTHTHNTQLKDETSWKELNLLGSGGGGGIGQGEYIETTNISLLNPLQSTSILWSTPGAKEVFIFEFGATVFWVCICMHDVCVYEYTCNNKLTCSKEPYFFLYILVHMRSSTLYYVYSVYTTHSHLYKHT